MKNTLSNINLFFSLIFEKKIVFAIDASGSTGSYIATKYIRWAYTFKNILFWIKDFRVFIFDRYCVEITNSNLTSYFNGGGGGTDISDLKKMIDDDYTIIILSDGYFDNILKNKTILCQIGIDTYVNPIFKSNKIIRYAL